MKKIMFNDKYGLTDAVLQGRKTMTRRLCKDKATKEIILADDVASWLFYTKDNIVEFVMKDGSVNVSVPPCKIGEVVAVAQPYNSFRPLISHNDDYSPSHPGWDNKMFVRADLMPHQIRITDIKVERLQDITEEGCICEGIAKSRFNDFPNEMYFPYKQCKDTEVCYTPRGAFQILIDRVSGKGTWESNPYVFAYTFELIK